jgi:hypothetical protein
MLGMRQIGQDRFGDPIFEVDLQNIPASEEARLLPALRQLLAAYRDLP